MERRFAELEAGTFGMSAFDSGDTRPKLVPERGDVVQVTSSCPHPFRRAQSMLIALKLQPRVRATVIDIKVQAEHVQRADSTDTLSVVDVKKSH